MLNGSTGISCVRIEAMGSSTGQGAAGLTFTKDGICDLQFENQRVSYLAT